MNLIEAFEEHKKVIFSYDRMINKDNYQEMLSEIYKYLKGVTDMYYANNYMNVLYQRLCAQVLYAEDRFSSRNKILDVSADFCLDDNFGRRDDFIKYLVYVTRKYLIGTYGYIFEYEDGDIDRMYLCYCHDASQYVDELCNRYGIKSYVIPIFPGYNATEELYDGIGFHYANIVHYNNKYYLVDVTYSQFFFAERNNLDRLGVVYLSGCGVGEYMLKTDKGKNIATTLLRDGYIEACDDVFKTYLDAFTMSFRNGLYYENTNDFSCVTPYTMDDYRKFLRGKDDQIRHEGRENLGYQKKPLRDSTFNFRRFND